jgi:hypothetical protein
MTISGQKFAGIILEWRHHTLNNDTIHNATQHNIYKKQYLA